MRDARSVREWWAGNPMTYGLDHGGTRYREGEVEPGSQEFFELVDKEFLRRKEPLHGDRPFEKIFPYERHRDGKVLEVGCGLGTMASCWAKAGARVTAVDLNPRAVELTRRRFDLHGLEGGVLEADGRRLPFEDEAFDYGYSWGVLHHSPDLERSLSELGRVIRPGGGFGLMLYNRNSILYRYQIQYQEGFLHLENRFLGPLEMASRYTDGDRDEGNPHTWPVTRDELTAMLGRWSDDVRVDCLGMDLDGIFPLLLPGLGLVVPRFLRKPWARRLGWFLWAHGTKRE